MQLKANTKLKTIKTYNFNLKISLKALQIRILTKDFKESAPNIFMTHLGGKIKSVAILYATHWNNSHYLAYVHIIYLHVNFF